MPLRYLVNAQGFQIHLQLFSPRKTSVLCHSTHPHMLLGNCSQVRNRRSNTKAGLKVKVREGLYVVEGGNPAGESVKSCT